jgi:hypothetical protein
MPISHCQFRLDNPEQDASGTAQHLSCASNGNNTSRPNEQRGNGNTPFFLPDQSDIADAPPSPELPLSLMQLETSWSFTSCVNRCCAPPPYSCPSHITIGLSLARRDLPPLRSHTSLVISPIPELLMDTITTTRRL